MFPNSHDTLPLPPHPQLEQYKKLAKELVRAASFNDLEKVRDWALHWLDSLQRLAAELGIPHSTSLVEDLEERANQIANYASQTLSNPPDGKYTGHLARAQFVIARCHGFKNWAEFAEHIDRLREDNSLAATFEAAADAVVSGEEQVLKALLSKNPDLVRARSPREHHATLLHYIGANGVENYRQKTPPNALTILEVLLEAGADVHAEAAIYVRSTALSLVATSGHPERAGVQIALMGRLLKCGASTEMPSRSTSRSDQFDSSSDELIKSCLASNRVAAAEFLAGYGISLSLEAAAALGRLEKVKSLLSLPLEHGGRPAKAQLEQGLLWAAAYGREDVVRFLLGTGVNIAAADRFGQTALHHAAMHADAAMVRLLLDFHAPLELANGYGGTPLGQVIWSACHSEEPTSYIPILQLLIGGGAEIELDHFQLHLPESIRKLLTDAREVESQIF